MALPLSTANPQVQTEAFLKDKKLELIYRGMYSLADAVIYNVKACACYIFSFLYSPCYHSYETFKSLAFYHYLRSCNLLQVTKDHWFPCVIELSLNVRFNDENFSILDFISLEKIKSFYQTQLIKPVKGQILNAQLKKIESLSKFLDGVCFGASLDYILTYLERRKKGDSFEEVIQKTSLAFKEQVTKKAAYIQLTYELLADKRYEEQRARLLLRKQKQKKMKVDQSLTKEEKFSSYHRRLIAKDCFKLLKYTAFLASTEPVKVIRERSLSLRTLNAQTGPNALRVKLQALPQGVYFMHLPGSIGNPGHAVCYIKEQSSSIMYDPNIGTWQVNGQNTAVFKDLYHMYLSYYCDGSMKKTNKYAIQFFKIELSSM